MLTDLQRRVRGIIAGLPEGAAVALAGGSALIVTGVVRRGTDDLDFFAAHPQPVAPMLDALEARLKEAGLRVTRLRTADTYVLLIESDSDASYVDLATDYRLMPALQTAEGLVLADRELAANKTLALFSRAEARDYVDFQALAQRFSLTELCDLAASKDGGCGPTARTPPVPLRARAKKSAIAGHLGLRPVGVANRHFTYPWIHTKCRIRS